MDQIEAFGAMIYRARIQAQHRAWRAGWRVAHGVFNLDDLNALAQSRMGRFRI